MNSFLFLLSEYLNVGSVVKQLKRRDCDQHGLGSKSTRTILLCPWKDTLRHIPLLGGPGKPFYISVISLFQRDSNILVSSDAGAVIAYPTY